jgi:hypothetical protein
MIRLEVFYQLINKYYQFPVGFQYDPFVPLHIAYIFHHPQQKSNSLVHLAALFYRFTSPNGTQGNYFSIIVHGDAIGSHIESIDVFIDGTTHNLLFGSTFSLSFLLFNKL